MRELALNDLFFLLYHILNLRGRIDHPWLFDRCQEVQENPNNHLDLWAREHFKSTIITFGLTIQDILNDPDITIGIFSFTRPAAKENYLRRIKWEFEMNKVLKRLFPDIVWENPTKESPKWSEDSGLLFKRKTNVPQATVEAWGLIDSMPVGAHFKMRIYDDMITPREVTNPDMIRKVTQAWELSLNLGSQQPCKRYKASNLSRYVGTRYHYNDPYVQVMSRGVAIPRIHPATDNGRVDGNPVLFSEEVLRDRRIHSGPYVFGCQFLLDPKADETQGLKEEWLKFWSYLDWKGYNLYLLCDPASGKKKDNDYTVILVIGLGPDENYYLIDGIRSRLNLTERTNKVFNFHRRYHPLAVGYEKYGKDSDVEHIEYCMNHENYRFNITELGGLTPKVDRIRRLVPVFEQGRFYIPEHLTYSDHEGKPKDLIHEFIQEEYKAFPVGVHDDILDCMARIVHEDLHAVFPKTQTWKPKVVPIRSGKPELAWMAV